MTSRSSTKASQTHGSFSYVDHIRRLDHMIRTRRRSSLQFLSEQLGVHERTVMRYLSQLRDMGAPIERHEELGGYSYSDDTFVLPALFLDRNEVLTLFAVGPLVAQFAGTPIARRFKTAVEKIVRSLPVRDRIGLGITAQRLGVQGAECAESDVRLFDALLQAVLQDRQVRVSYYSLSRDQVTERVVDPYSLRAIDGTWYVVGWCHERRDFRLLHLARFREVLATGQGFERRRGFDVDRWLEETFGAFHDELRTEVVVRLTGWAGRLVAERRWHRSQRTEAQPDGSVLVRWSVAGMPDVERFILEWGEYAEVLAPADLRERIATRLRTAAARYDAT